MLILFRIIFIYCTGKDEENLYKSINQYRRQKNLPPFNRSVQLDRVASQRVTYVRNNSLIPEHSKELQSDFEIRVKKAGYLDVEKLSDNLKLIKNIENADFYSLMTDLSSKNPNINPLVGDYIDVGISSAISSDKNKRYWDIVFGKKKNDNPVPPNLTIEGTL